MNYIIKDLVFVKKESIDLCTTYKAYITIHDVIDVQITIIELIPDNEYTIQFYSNNGRKVFDMSSDDSCSNYSKFGFKSYKEAYEYANKEMKSMLNNFISNVLVDIDNYIEEIGEI